MANWPLYIDEERGTPQEVRAGERHEDQVRRGDQRQHRVLRKGPPAVRPGRVRRPRHPRGDGLDGGAHDAARLRPEVRQVRRCRTSTSNLIERLKSPPFDPQREFSAPWQSGFTGIIYRKDKVKREPKSIDDLFDPDYKGKVTMLTEMRDSVGLVAASHGQGSREGHASTSSWRRSTRSARARTRARSAASPATSTRRTSPRATRG